MSRLDDWADGWNKGYDVALRDAVEAVEADLTARIMREMEEGDADGLKDGLLYALGTSVAAIEALGAER